ncbi:hypothetical protein V490_06910 [Pseudogymnoascus sp. VKM F-3557]|nr:hypothetical protein V490_06910 [Pseudogymnoascus sp. VKM F-3557]
MVQICPRIQFHEITDQAWFPEYLLRMVQSCLTVAWNFRMPIMQKHSPAQVVTSLLYNTLDKKVIEYSYVDFCAGGGGPTPCIERELNQRLAKTNSSSEPNESVKFVMTDLHPHIPEWKEACSKSKNLTYVSKPVDATNAPADLLEDDGKKVFRMFNLSFHHFDDKLGRDILKNTLETSDGFGIFELTDRSPPSLMMITFMGVLFFFITPFYFWRSPGHLFFTYVIPIIPFVLVFDGLVSSLRTRTPDEMRSLLKTSGGDMDGWRITSGREMHTEPLGSVTWIMGVKE